MDLSALIYKITKSFPDSEKFGITNQLRRASNSIGANIAVGSGRKSSVEKARFFEIAFSSLLELIHFLRLSVKLDFIKDEDLSEVHSLISEISNKLNALHKQVKQ
ncbi:MAG: four helix bundle protein [Saprospiraceae bacterium]|nr:four helix bundle protein [Saprospiraceae bacterium]